MAGFKQRIHCLIHSGWITDEYEVDVRSGVGGEGLNHFS